MFAPHMAVELLRMVAGYQRYFGGIATEGREAAWVVDSGTWAGGMGFNRKDIAIDICFHPPGIY